jgi:hypothetical protein
MLFNPAATMSQDFDLPVNPYAPVVTQPGRLAPNSQAVQIRKANISHEASVRSIGALYLLGAFFLTLAGLAGIGLSLYAMFGGRIQLDSPPFLFAIGVIELVVGIFQGKTGLALRKLQSSGRVGGIVFSTIGLIGFPFGTLISAYFLYLLLSKKGVYVFSDEYKQVIAETPEVKLRTSVIVWIFLALLLAAIGVAVVGVLYSVFTMTP